jgi:hypothetical protein
MASIATLRESFTDRRTAREQHRQLARELATYSSESDRLDLDAILARHDADETREVRTILAQQDVTRTAEHMNGILAHHGF